MNQHKADNESISLLDVIGSAVIDNYYNHLYDKAISIKEKTSNSITECYRTIIIDYVKDIENPKSYKDLIRSIHFYTTIATCFNDITYVQCLNLYTKIFIPNQYFDSMTEIQKNNVLYMILKDSISVFTQYVLSSHISMIIDDHHNSENIAILQNLFLEILINQRDISYSKFINIESNKKNTPIKAKVSKIKKVSKVKDQLMINIGNKYKKCIEENANIKKDYNILKNKYKNLSTKGVELQNLFLEQINEYKKSIKDINDLKDIIKSQQSKITQLQSNMNNQHNEISRNNRTNHIQSNGVNHRQYDSRDNTEDNEYTNDFTFDSLTTGPNYLED